MRSRERSSRENRRFSCLEKVLEDFLHGQLTGHGSGGAAFGAAPATNSARWQFELSSSGSLLRERGVLEKGRHDPRGSLGEHRAHALVMRGDHDDQAQVGIHLDKLPTGAAS